VSDHLNRDESPKCANVFNPSLKDTLDYLYSDVSVEVHEAECVPKMDLSHLTDN